MTAIKVVKADITTLKVGAIVNAANTGLRGGGGVDGAIHRAAGMQELNAACAKFHGCPTGEAVITSGFKLPAKYIIHTPGPVWHGGNHNEDQLLANSYRHSLELAAQNGCHNVAFSSISTGVYGFPLERAAKIAIKTIRDFIRQNDSLDEVIICAFDPRTATAYRQAIAA